MAKIDYAYPPDRKRPRGENRRALPAKQNTYRAAPASAASKGPESLFSSKLLLVALAGGAAFAWFRASAGTSAQPTLPGSSLPTGTGSGTGSGSAPNTGSSTPTGTTLPARPAIVPPLPTQRYVFVQSVGGETLFERLRQEGSLPEGYGLPSSAIVRASNGELLGQLTGRTFQPKPNYPAMHQVHCLLPGGFECNYWVDSEEVVVFGQADAQAYINRQLGRYMGAATAQAIKDYFLRRYGK